MRGIPARMSDTPILIEDPADPRVAAYRDVRERDLVGREGRFIAEGEVVLRLLLASRRFETESILIADNRAETLAPLLNTRAPGVPVYLATRGVLDEIAGFPLHRGILAVGRRGPDLSPEDLLDAAPERAVVVIAMGIGNHDNIGGIFRNAAAFGAAGVLLGADCCDPLYRKAIRVSVGAALTMPFAKLERGVDPVELTRSRGFEPLALSPGGSIPLASLPPPARAAVILGSEGPGLPPDVITRATAVSIPMAPGFDSLNVAVTAGIVLFHLTRAGS